MSIIYNLGAILTKEDDDRVREARAEMWEKGTLPKARVPEQADNRWPGEDTLRPVWPKT